MIKEEDPRFRNLHRKVAVFAVAALVLVAVVVVLIGRESDLFTRKIDLTFTADKGTGFARGMPVKLSGFRIGRVADIVLNEEARVDVVIQVADKYRKWLRRDSTAKLVKEGMIGDAVVDISVGSPAMPPLEDGDRLAYVKVKALDELAADIAEKVKPVLIEVRDIIGYVNDPDGDIKQSMRNIRKLSRDLDGTRRTLDLLLTRTGEDVHLLSGRLAITLDEAAKSMRTAESSLGALDRRLPAMLDQTERILDNTEKASADLERLTGHAADRVPAVIDKSERTMDDAAKVVDALKRTWPISSMIDEPDEIAVTPGNGIE